eukprot:1153600-Pelagomonas_calceolata.AAC.4
MKRKDPVPGQVQNSSHLPWNLGHLSHLHGMASQPFTLEVQLKGRPVVDSEFLLSSFGMRRMSAYVLEVTEKCFRSGYWFRGGAVGQIWVI